jgi:membrane protein implicated in regulation of membrane protease activity
VLELLGSNRTVKGTRRVVGAETLIGREAVVVDTCRPVGQVRLDAEIWRPAATRARARAPASAIVGREGFTLVVEPTAER